MPITEPITLHAVPFSHPCMTVRAALRHKDLEFEEVMLQPGNRDGVLEDIYGEGRTTVPGIVVGETPVHSSVGIMRYLDQEVSGNPLYPEPVGDGVRGAEEWGDSVLQGLARRLTFGALHFRPGSMGTFAGDGEMDPAGTDFAMKYLHLTWKYLGLTASGLIEDLAALPAAVEQVEEFAERDLIDNEGPTAADFQIAASARLLMTIGDLKPMLDETAAERIATRYFAGYDGAIPAGAFPPGWISG